MAASKNSLRNSFKVALVSLFLPAAVLVAGHNDIRPDFQQNECEGNLAGREPMNRNFSSAIANEHLYEEVEDTCQLKVLTPTLSCRKTAKILLPNGLSVYLISDEKADGSAAAVSVKAGHWNDPKEYPGMAHLVEHLLFMGTNVYPDENGFSSFLADHDGKCNAYTSTDHTAYMFSIHHDSFLEALDQFAHFFIDPLLNTASIQRELQNVDQEHAKNVENDGWRRYMIQKETGNPNHPNRSFSTGNSETLSRIPNEVMRKWVESNYSANLMNLVVYSSLPLPELKAQVSEIFHLVPNRGLVPQLSGISILSEAQKGHLTAIKPVKNLQLLSLEWELPMSFFPDETKSANVIAYALKRGSASSLSEVLKKEGLIQGFDVGVERMGNKNRFFAIECELTPKGLREKNTVIERCFQALKNFQQNGIPLYVFQEMTEMAKRSYEFQTREDPFRFIMEEIRAMNEEPLSSFPQKSLLATSYDPQKIALFLKTLSPRACQFYLLADPKKTHIQPEKKEKWMGAEYAVKPIPEELLVRWETISLNPEIKTPSPNPFIPTNLSLLSDPKTPVESPLKLMDNRYASAFYFQDSESPEIALHLHFSSPLLGKTPLSFALADLYLQHLNESFHTLLDTAEAAGLSASFSFERYRLNLRIHGYSEKAGLFLQKLIKEMKERLPSQEEFQNNKESLVRSYENLQKDLPLSQAAHQLSALLKEKPTGKEKLAQLEAISYEQFLTFQKNLFQSAFLEAFLSGNLLPNEAEGMLLDTVHFLGFNPYPLEKRPVERVLSLSSMQGPFLSLENTSSQGNAAILLLDGGEFSFERRASQQILGTALREAFFDTLRTKQKTGYIVQSSDEEFQRRLFQIFSVQSNTHGPKDLLFRFELFLEDFHSNTASYIPKERFENIKRNLIATIEKQGRNLEERSKLGDLFAFQYDEDFLWLEKRIQGLESVSYESFLQFGDSLLSKENRGRLAILVQGKGKEFAYESVAPGKLKEITSYQERKSVKPTASSE